MVRWITKWFTVWIAAGGVGLSTPAMACLFNDEFPVEADASQFDQVFSGLIIWTDRFEVPPSSTPATSEFRAIDPGYWIKSKVLVFRVWRGTPPPVAEVWTLVSSDCESPPFPGLYFEASTKRDGSRSVAENSYYSRAVGKYLTRGPATFATAGVAAIGAILCFGCIMLVWLAKIVRRRVTGAGPR
jgi:hypothetical protein